MGLRPGPLLDLLSLEVREPGALTRLIDRLVDQDEVPDSADAARRTTSVELSACAARLRAQHRTVASQIGMLVIHAAHAIVEGKPIGNPDGGSQLAFSLEEVASHLQDGWARLMEDAATLFRRDLSLEPSAHGAGLPWVPGYHSLALLDVTRSNGVFRAMCEWFDEAVALKVHTGTQIERMRRELALMRKLDHPLIVPVTDAGTCFVLGQPSIFIATRFIEGTTLEHFDLDDVDLHRRVDLFAQACEAVGAAHAQGIAHRDLHPRNILVTDEGSPRLIDFGLGLELSSDPDSDRMTRTGAPLGARGYTSPELLLGRRGASAALSDVYSLGAVLFFILARQPPHHLSGLSLDQIVRRICIDGARPVRSVAPEVPRALALVVERALQIRPRDRYASVADLRAAATGSLCGDVPPTPLSVQLRRSRARLARLPLAPASVLLLLAVSWFLIDARQRAGHSEHQMAQAASVALDALHGSIQLRKEVSEDVRRLPNTELPMGALGASLLQLTQFPGTSATARRLRCEALEVIADDALRFGALERAEDLRREVLRCRREIVSSSDASPADLMQLSLALVRIGDVRKERGDIESARDFFESALEIDVDLAGSDPTRRLLDNLVWSYQRLAHLQRRRAASSALELAKQGYATSLRLAQLDDDDSRTHHSRCAMALTLLDVLEDAPDETRSLIEEILSNAKKLRAVRPHSITACRLLLGSLDRAAHAAANRGEFVAAMGYAQEALAEAQSYAQESRREAQALASLAAAHLRVADVLAKSPDSTNESRAHFERSLARTEEALDAGFPRVRGQLLAVRIEIGLMCLGQHEGPRQPEDHGRDVLQRLADLPRGHGAEYERHVYAVSVYAHGPEKLRDPARALVHAHRALRGMPAPSASSTQILADALATFIVSAVSSELRIGRRWP